MAELVEKGVHIANGTDTPVEDVDPIRNFMQPLPAKEKIATCAFFRSNDDARWSHQIIHPDNAYAAKEEQVKGSLSVGKYAT